MGLNLSQDVMRRPAWQEPGHQSVVCLLDIRHNGCKISHRDAYRKAHLVPVALLPLLPVPSSYISATYSADLECMAIIQAQIARVVQVRGRISLVDSIAIIAAILSLLTMTVLLPGGLHLP